MNISVNELHLRIFSEPMLVVTDTHYLKPLEIMNKLVWQLYNDNMISIEVANLLLDQHYNRLNNKKYE